MVAPPIYVDRSTYGDHKVLRTQIRNLRIWPDWKYRGLIPLIELALSGPEEALWWLLSQLPRYSFCGICGNELEGLALVAWGWKSLFPCWPTLHYLFCYHIYRHGDTQKGHLGCCLSLYDSLFLLQPGLYSGMCTAHVRQMLPLIVLPWERFWETTLANQTKVLVVRNWKSIRDAIRSTPGASPPYLGDRTQMDE